MAEKRKRPRDVNQMAASVVDEATAGRSANDNEVEWTLRVTMEQSVMHAPSIIRTKDEQEKSPRIVGT